MKMKNHHRYLIINWIIILIAIGFLGLYFEGMSWSVFEMKAERLAFLAVSVVCVYLLKMLRLYVALTGTGITFQRHLQLFFKTAPVSLLLPFKLGDLYRMYCYGFAIQGYLRSAVTILLDRFMDTLALITVILVFAMMQGFSASYFIYVFVLFLVISLAVYYTFPAFFAYWNRYLIESPATGYRIFYLKFLNSLNRVYKEIQLVVQGRFMTMYVLSLLAWMVELGLVALASGVNFKVSSLVRYLESALGIGLDSVQQLFVLGSIAFTIGVCLVLYVFNFMRKGSRK